MQRGWDDAATAATEGDVGSPIAGRGDAFDSADDLAASNDEPQISAVGLDQLLEEDALTREPVAARERAQAAPERVAARAEVDVLAPAAEPRFDNDWVPEARVDIPAGVGRSGVREPACAESDGGDELVVRAEEGSSAVEDGDAVPFEGSEILESGLWPREAWKNIESTEGRVSFAKPTARLGRCQEDCVGAKSASSSFRLVIVAWWATIAKQVIRGFSLARGDEGVVRS